MRFKIFDKRPEFYQWDSNVKVTLPGLEAGEQVHFSNNGVSAYVVEAYEFEGEIVADVPNILLRSAEQIDVYKYTNDHTEIHTLFSVRERAKPENYIYTETEIKRYEDLEKRIENLEKGGTADIDLSDYYTKEEVDEKIPAPYTLPTASATVKGGVKVGEGLQMDGEVLKVKKGVYELIETITMAEEATLERTQEPDGTPYNFKRVMVLFKHPTNSTGNVYGRYYCGAVEIGRGYIPTNTNTSSAYSMHEIMLEAGLWRSWYKSKVNTKENSAFPDSFYTGSFFKYKESDYPTIDKILLESLTVGTVIEIWGVRA